MTDTTHHDVLMDAGQIDAGQDGIGFVDLHLNDLDGNPIALISIYHSIVPDVIAELIKQWGALMDERNRPK